MIINFIKRKFRLTAFSIFLAAAATNLGASPMMPIPMIDVSGTIASISWQPEIHEKGIWGMSGSLGSDRTFPAHYEVTLSDCEVEICVGELESPMIVPGHHESYDLSLNHKQDDGFLKPGMKIKVLGYNRSGDEGGIWTSFDKIEILPETATQTEPVADPDMKK